jgi:uncharacterized protein YcbX
LKVVLGRVCALTRYPVKSMAGIDAERVALGWHGLEGDRRHAFRHLGNESDFPWLSASRLPELLLYHPLEPSHVRTPAGRHLELRGEEMQSEIAERWGSPVELMRLRQGIFDDGTVSVIALRTMAAIGDEAGMLLDRRRFRANIVLDTHGTAPFLEDGWVGGMLVFGEGEGSAVVSVTKRDERCVMINLDPDTAEQDARVMKAAVRLNDNHAGVYGAVLRPGVLQVGQPVSLVPQWPMGSA